ncbi:short-chain dehydrogenase [Mycobacterium intermedium]|uniref:Short-chain dehydrogenase n=1 Tax=Mycobacterium intermedium TaxID=28445 RepID=A0A1E3SF83_MYCIE|nr:SDR family NAD(P)-dependent oxidoreductase [Mycobacterium intermedium]MCV6966655.1 SDR family NAD(P)-dependent oxidoreductase [Mycobacterium intermedium]ODR00826.1 short-chain dehydrogenase [Mycobacterium intermedium]OPE52145.1 short-chain dehydrogenase [Mycobacterium intermedium]ORB10567.1 short-chain dehydrogenase [Mycobacterium intermedium]
MGSLRSAPARSKSIVITGASSGLGRAAAIHLSKIGYRVFAGVRSEGSAGELAALPPSLGELIPVSLDVTDGTSIARAADFIDHECTNTGLWAVINNAGVCISAPLECIPIDLVRTQLETNVVGALALLQHLLPLLRASGGRVVNVSSGIGNVAPAYLGAYAAAQFAKEALSDALRRELRPLGVSVSIIQPGAIHTPLWGKIRESADQIMSAAPADLSVTYRAKFAAFLEMNEARGQASKTTPTDFADTVAVALAAKRPKVRYRVGLDSWGTVFARRMVPDRIMDAVIAAGLDALTAKNSQQVPAHTALSRAGDHAR